MQSFDWSNQILSVAICHAYIMLKNDLIMQFPIFHHIMLNEPHLLIVILPFTSLVPWLFLIRGNEAGYEATHLPANHILELVLEQYINIAIYYLLPTQYPYRYNLHKY